ncbi:MAG TPA: hypothetical protein P5531_12395 [Bacteroidales bacterium]|nr:hypothetical protein [Bacteroidales bacterium]HSA44360.1 hypothetical protein [Bacteroidales bacterium]
MITKLITVLLLIIHGLIHLMGFLKAYHLASIASLSRLPGKVEGIFWLFAAVLLILAALFYLMKHPMWFIPAMVALLLSQVLIVVAWNDARYGTLVNVLLLLILLPAAGRLFFEVKAGKAAERLLSGIGSGNPERITRQQIAALPLPVRTWLDWAGLDTGRQIRSVRLEQKGEMRTSPGGRWMSFQARQLINPVKPAFVWQADVQMMPFVHLSGLDRYIEGQGMMQISLLSLIKVVDESNNEKINTGTAIRYLSEICWVPHAALNKHIRWEAGDALSARAWLEYQGVKVRGDFYFSPEGHPVAFEAIRYYGSGEHAQEERWRIENEGMKEFDGVKVPAKSSVTWKLKDGDFNWLKLEVTVLEYDEPELIPD